MIVVIGRWPNFFALAQGSDAMYNIWLAHGLELMCIPPKQIWISLLSQGHVAYAFSYCKSSTVVL